MKRPFSCIGFSMLFSLVFAIAVHTAVFQAAVVCFALSAVLFVLNFVCKKNTISAAVCCLSACVAMFSYMGAVKYYVEPLVKEYDGKAVTFSGMIVSSPYTNGSNTHFTVKTDTIDNEKKSVKISVTTNSTLPMEIYDYVDVKATLSSNYENGYGYASYYGARNIFLTTYINSYYDGEYSIIHNDNKPFYSIFTDLRNYCQNTFRKYLSYNEASLCIAIITGDREHLRDDVYTAFKNLGVSHIIVVSGLHLSIVASFLCFTASNTFDNKYISSILQILGVTAFAGISGFGFSVRRALIMFIVVIIGRCISIKPDALNSLGLAAFLLCLNPLNIGDIGLIWSFSCTMSIILFANKISDYLMRKYEIKNYFLVKLTNLFSTSSAALFGSIPFFVLVTGSISPYTILVNILTVPFTGILIISGGFAVLFFAVQFDVLAYPLMFMAGMTAKYLTYVTDMFQDLQYSSVRIDQPFIYIWFAVTAALLVLILIIDKRKMYLSIALIVSAAVFMGLFSFNTVLKSDKFIVSVLDVGNGMTITVKDNKNLVVLNSYGEKYQYNTIKNEISVFGDIACLIDIPPNKTKYNYCRRITHDFNVNKIIVNDDKIYNEKYSYFRYTGTDVQKAGSNYWLNIFDDVTLNVITTENFTWEYLHIYGREILICSINSDFDELPESFKAPDIALISDIPKNFSIDENAYIVVSAYGDEYSTVMNTFENSNMTVEATNGNGRIDFIFSENGNVDVKRTYTGGVTRYADNR